MNYPTSAVETREWRYEDKSTWGKHGSWQDEPDKMQWTDKDTGLPCLVVRGPSGALCGYAGVPKSHPWFGKEYGDCTLDSATPKGEDKSDSLYREDPNSYYQRSVVTALQCDNGKWYCDHTPGGNLDCHGGVTFSGACAPHKDDPERGVCHVVPGDEQVWWFGFDCAHSGDGTPARDSSGYDFDRGGWYRDIAYVKEHSEGLARQLDKVEA